jgi:hypothetical protein
MKFVLTTAHGSSKLRGLPVAELTLSWRPVVTRSIFACSLLLLSVAVAAQTVCFNEVDTRTGPDPTRAVLFDSNGDGKFDLGLIAGSAMGNTFGTDSLLGNGDGTFAKIKAYYGPTKPSSITAGDFNGDGKSDLALSFSINNGGLVGILLGNGDGTFGNVHQVATTRAADTIVTGDFNRDGKMDVAITTGLYVAAGADIELLLGNGDGTLQSPTVVTALPWYTTALSVADLNGDGKLDLISDGGNTDDNGQVVTVVLGNGDGTFQTPQRYTSASLTGAQGFAVADLNGDGVLDVAVPGGAGMDLFFGTGAGTLTGPTFVSTPTAPLSIAALDIFGNGLQDLAGTEGSGGARISIAVNQGGGNFTSQTFNVRSTNYYVYAGDVNNDGKPDLVVLFIDNSGFGVLLNCS